MFTGIVEEKGTIEKIERRTNLSVLLISAKKIVRGLKVGDSIAVNGVCLTVTKISGPKISFDIMKETILKTNLALLKSKSKVNLERALKANGRLDGHFVTGHIDGIGKIRKRISQSNYEEYHITYPKALAPYLVPKGCVCVDGISLTVGEVKKSYFSIYMIPHTLKVTTIGKKERTDLVNIETDILAKYILKDNLQ